VEQRYAESGVPEILLLGGSGFVGSALGEKFVTLGWRVRIVTRSIRPFQTSFPCEQFVWDGKAIPLEAIEGVTAVINLAGQPIFDHSWTQSYRRLVLDSRRDAGRALRKAMETALVKPKVVLQISGTDYYGMHPRAGECDEASEAGSDFMALVGKVGEEPVEGLDKYTRLCIVRMGLVLGWEGGGLPKLWDVYASGCGGVLGNGSQWLNWVHVDDITVFCAEAVGNEQYRGIYNLVAPANATNRELHLRFCAHTPSLKFLAVPKFYLKTLMGQRAHFLLQAPKVNTPRAEKHGFTYQYPNLESAFKQFMAERTHRSAHYKKVKQWLPKAPSELSIANNSTTSFESHFFYGLWHHQVELHSLGQGTLIEDRMEYKLRLFPMGQAMLSYMPARLNKKLAERRVELAKSVGSVSLST